MTSQSSANTRRSKDSSVQENSLISPRTKGINFSKYEGKCVGLADGKVVASNKSVNVVMKKLSSDYRGQKISLLTVPKKNKILVL